MRLSTAVLAVLASSATIAVEGANFCDLIRCSSKIEPVCASNGVSYDNACMFQIAKCHNDKLSIKATGKCATAVPVATTATPAATTAKPAPAASVTAAPTAVCEMMCLDMFEPVCGSDGKTYTNKCQLQLANCNNRVENAATKAVTVASVGECGAEAAITVGPVTEAPTKNETSGDADAGVDGNATEPVRLCEVMCPMVVQPVCGSDGVTYSNACELQRASCKSRVALTQVSEGECAGAEPTATPSASTAAPIATAPASSCRRACTKIMKPVCGSNGVTYNNKCEFENAKCTLRIATMSFKEGKCAAAAATPAPSTTTVAPAATATTNACPRVCTMIMQPVCGSNGVTYSNQCEFENAKCTLRIANLSATEGECAAADASLPTAAPAATTPAPTTRTCSQMCPANYSPVCGSNGNTYSNMCHFNMAKCKLGAKSATLAVASEGACAAAADVSTDALRAATGTGSACPRACTQVIKPVCGSDGVTYNNKCAFEMAKCTKRIAASVMTFVDGECA